MDEEDENDLKINTKYSRRETAKAPFEEGTNRGQQIIDDVSGTGIDSTTLSQTLTQLFSRARKPDGGAKGYSMLMSSGAVSGTVSGNLVKALNKRTENNGRNSTSSPMQPSPQVDRSGYGNATFDEEDSEEDAFEEMLPYEDYQE